MRESGKRRGIKLVNRRCIIGLSVSLCLAVAAHAQDNTQLNTNQLRELASRCAPKVHADTIISLIRQESASYIYALSINYPKTEAARQGYEHASYELARQPRNRQEALAWTRWFITHRHSVSIGLMQVSSQEARRLGINDLRALFDPCVNIAAGAVVLQDAYRDKANTLDGLKQAFAQYNAGSIARGIANGYASGVVAKAPPLTRRLHVPSPTPEASQLTASHPATHSLSTP